MAAMKAFKGSVSVPGSDPVPDGVRWPRKLSLAGGADAASGPGRRATPRGERRRSRTTLILVANEPRAYREVLFDALRILRPLAEVVVADPRDLDAEVERRAPNLVVCSRLTGTVEALCPAWIELYPDGSQRATARLGRERVSQDGLDLKGLLALVDRATDPALRRVACG